MSPTRISSGFSLPRVRFDRGFTLVEIMVALAVGMVILLALTTIFARNTGNQSELERMTRQLEGARFSLDALSEDIMHAGYFGEFNPNTLPTAPAYQTPDPCATATNAQGWNTGVTPVQIPVAIQGIAAGTAVACLTNRAANTQAVVIRRADTGPDLTFAGGNTNNLYLQVSRCDKDVPPTYPADRLVAAAVPVATPQATFVLRRPDCATINDRIRRLTQRTYYIASCNECAPSDGVPTLKRVEVIDGVLRTASIAEGVENLQIEYGLDTNNDGRPDSYNTMGSGVISGAAPNVWENVVSARVHLLARSVEPTPGFVDARTYQLGPGVSIVPTADRFKRTLMTSTVRLVNVGMRRE
jgi:type IV pilus assembly protein PilW